MLSRWHYAAFDDEVSIDDEVSYLADHEVAVVVDHEVVVVDQADQVAYLDLAEFLVPVGFPVPVGFLVPVGFPDPVESLGRVVCLDHLIKKC